MQPTLSFALTLFLLAGLSTGAQSSGDREGMTVIDLPSPVHAGNVSIEESIYSRKSIRSFQSDALDLQTVSQLLWATGGKTVDGITGPSRSFPSAGGIYPIEIYIVVGRAQGIKEGLYRYSWQEHRLILAKEGDLRGPLAHAALDQMFIEEAPITIVLTAYYQKTTRIYGNRGAERYVPMDAGHAAQNLYLQASALRLGTVAVGSFHDASVKQVLGLKREEPLYLLPVGKPRGSW
jgi:SagB-type dehydrogenase family enzyme